MNSHLFQISYLSLLMILLSVHFPSSSLAAGDENFTACSQPFQCANLKEVKYPFWGGNRQEFCGHPRFQLDCQGEAPILKIESRQYRVLDIENSSFVLQVARAEFYDDNCPQYLYNATLDTDYFNYVKGTENLTLHYGCQTLPGVLVPNQFNCTVNGSTTPSASYFLLNGVALTTNTACNTTVNVQVDQTAAQSLTNSSNLRQVLVRGFGLQWEANNTRCSECVQTSGVCGSDSTSGSFLCHCADGPHPDSCNTTGPTRNGNRGGSDNSMKIGLPMAGAVIAGIALGWAIFACRQKRKRVAYDQNVNVFLRHYGSLSSTQYRYSDIATMTNSFKDKIGQGGYGAV